METTIKIQEDLFFDDEILMSYNRSFNVEKNVTNNIEPKNLTDCSDCGYDCACDCGQCGL
jgi:hypothetical protein